MGRKPKRPRPADSPVQSGSDSNKTSQNSKGPVQQTRNVQKPPAFKFEGFNFQQQGLDEADDPFTTTYPAQVVNNYTTTHGHHYGPVINYAPQPYAQGPVLQDQGALAGYPSTAQQSSQLAGSYQYPPPPQLQPAYIFAPQGAGGLNFGPPMPPSPPRHFDYPESPLTIRGQDPDKIRAKKRMTLFETEIQELRRKYQLHKEHNEMLMEQNRLLTQQNQLQAQQLHQFQQMQNGLVEERRGRSEKIHALEKLLSEKHTEEVKVYKEKSEQQGKLLEQLQEEMKTLRRTKEEAEQPDKLVEQTQEDTKTMCPNKE